MGRVSAKPTDQSPETKAIAFLNVTVIPMDTERMLPDHTVVVMDGHIIEIGPTTEVKVPAGAFSINAMGQYLIPALTDMHVHLLGEAWNIMFPPNAQFASKNIDFGKFLFPYVANGVTTLQVLSATPDHVTLRDQISRGEILGPRLILARMIDGPKKAWPPPLSTWVSSADEAREAVLEAKKAGYDKIKVYSFLSQEAYDAIVKTAREVKMDVIGHIPMSLSVEYVLNAGQKLIAHSEEVGKHAHGDLSAEHIDYFADLIAKRGVWMIPTLVTTRSILGMFEDPAKLLARSETKYCRHPMEQGVWSFILENLYLPIPSEERKQIRRYFEEFQRPFTKAFHDRGGKLMTGSDTILPGIVPGFSLHWELKELVDVGLSPYEALRASTTLPFEYLGELDKAGTIEVGKQSDLVLLDENPLHDVSGASKIAGVLIQGRWLGKDEIQKKLKELEASFETPGAPPPTEK